MEEEKGRVCVTGGTGFLGSWLVKKLLEQSYSVNTTIRPSLTPEHKKDVSFLTNLPQANKKLKIFEADMNQPESFKPAIEGCSGVFHVAATIDTENKEPEEVVIRRSVESTLAIMKACLESNTVKKFVYTSSAGTTQFSGKAADVLDETFWSDVDYIKSLNVLSPSRAYIISKIMAEKKALEFGEYHGLDVVTIIPPFIHGPFICSKFPLSVRASLAMILGERENYGLLLNTPMVHIDDVARAQIFLFEHGEAKGRYICSSHTIAMEEMFKFVSANYPEFPIPTIESLSNVQGFRGSSYTSKKLFNLGFEFKYGLKEMFDGAIQSAKAKGYL